VAAGAIVTGVYQAHRISILRSQLQAVTQKEEQQSALTNQIQELQRERDRAKSELAALSADSAAAKKSPTEVLKLRGEVGRLRQENADIASTNAISKLTSNPEARKMLRDQQKMGMSMIYKGFANDAKLSSEQSEKLNDLLADHIMENVDHVTTALRDKTTTDQMSKVFAAEEQALQDKVQTLLGPDGLAQYQDYTKNLLANLTADQFKSMLTGTDEEKAEKSKQLAQIMREQVQAALSSAGLPADYQTVPILNFINIASEQEGQRSLQLLDDIYQSVAARAGTFLSADDLAKFQDFRSKAINNNRTALTLNRTLMAPIAN
jgi:hypothetical protein